MSTVVSNQHIEEAAKLLGKKILDSVTNGRQALLLSDQTYLHRLTLGSINRDVNPKWVATMKQEMMRLIMSRERVTLVACIDIREIQRIIEEQADVSEFKAFILDGQHRYTALKELLEFHPALQYEFWLQVYIVTSEIEMQQLLEDMDRRLLISQKDKNTIVNRQAFSNAIHEVIPHQHHHRRCVTGTINHKILREPIIVNALQNYKKEDLVIRIREVAKKFHDHYTHNAPKTTSVLAKVIEDTKLYQFIDWEKGSWIYEMLDLTPPNV